MRGQNTEEKVKSLDNKLVKLKEQNQKLSEQVCSQRNVVTSLEDTISSHEDRWRDFQSTLLCVNRCWELLHHDISLLKSRVGGSEAKGIKEEDGLTAGEPLGESATWEDPFIAALISPWEDKSGESDVMGHISKADRLMGDVEKSLNRKADGTRAMMTSLLADIRAMEDQNKSSSNYQIDEEMAELRAAAEKEAACSRALLERTRIAEDKLFQKTHELQETKNELADKQGQVERAERKLLSLRLQSNKVHDAPEQKLPPGFGGFGSAEQQGSVGPSQVKKEEEVDAGAGPSQRDAEEDDKWKKILDSKVEEWEAEREGFIQSEKELASLRHELSSENFVLETSCYQMLQEQKSQLMLDVKKKDSEILSLQQQLVHKDREMQRKKGLDPDGRCRDFQALQEAQKRIADLQQQLVYAEQARHESEIELQSERDKRGDVQTVQELKRMVKVLQDEITMKERSFRDRMVSEEKIRAAREESQELGRNWKEAQVKLDRMRSELEESERKKLELDNSQKEHKAIAGDLRVFVEVLTTFCQDRRSEAEIRSSEEKLRREVAEMKDKGGGLKVEDVLEESKKVKSKLREAESECDHVKLEVDRLQRESRHLQEDLSQQKALNSGLEQEVEATGRAYEDMQAQNIRLLQQATEKDDAIDQLRGQITQQNQQNARLKLEVDNKKDALRLSSRAAEEVGLIRSEFEGNIEELKVQLKEAQEETLSMKRGLESVQDVKQRKDVEIEGLQEQVETFKKVAKDRKRLADEGLEKSIREVRKRQRLEKELEGLHGGGKSGDLSMDDRKEMEILEIEVEELRKTLNCSVCESNRKSVVLTKCWHTFCRQCITNRLETRNRKCPGCGTHFGQADVKSLFLT